MLEGGFITYGATQSVLLSFHPSNPLVAAFIIAFLTTILSYQATAAFHDLFLGPKPHGTTKTYNIPLFLLTNRQSLPPLFRSVFRRPDLSSARHVQPLKPSVCFRLTLLLLTAPIVNILAILLTLENDTFLTFSEAQFGGVALGINFADTPVRTRPLSDICERVQTKLPSRERPLVDFVTCVTPPVDSTSDASQGNASVHVYAHSQFMVLIRIKTPVGGGQAWSIAHLVSTAGAPRGAFNYRMRHAVDQRTAIRFANLVIQPIRQWCGGNPPIQEREEPTFVKETDANAFRFIQCNRQPTAEDGKWLSDLRDNVYRRITLVNTDTLQITDVGNLSTSSNTYTAENEFIFANDLPFVKRRRNFASFWVLFVLAAVAVLFKLIIRFVSGNDLMRGVGLVVREELGILCCDSMLPRGDIIVHHGPRGLRYEKELPKGAHEADPDRK